MADNSTTQPDALKNPIDTLPANTRCYLEAQGVLPDSLAQPDPHASTQYIAKRDNSIPALSGKDVKVTITNSPDRFSVLVRQPEGFVAEPPDSTPSLLPTMTEISSIRNTMTNYILEPGYIPHTTDSILTHGAQAEYWHGTERGNEEIVSPILRDMRAKKEEGCVIG